MKNNNNKSKNRKQLKKTPQPRAKPVYRKKEPDNSIAKLAPKTKLTDTIINPTQEATYQNIVRVTPQFNPAAYKELFANLTAFFLSRNVVGQSDDIVGDAQKFYDGMVWMFQKMAEEVAGTPALSVRLSIINDLIKAWQPKDVITHKFYKTSYSWNDIVTSFDGIYSTWNVNQPIVPNLSDLGTYDSSYDIYTPTPSEEAYSFFLTQVKSIQNSLVSMLSVVDSGHKSSVEKDVSAFAKVYSYLGLNPSLSGGFWNDIENEVDIRCPILAHNVIYNVKLQDNRVPRKLTTNEGGPGVALAPLLPQFRNWYNKSPISFKFLDLYEVVNTLIYWYMTAAVEDQKNTGNPLSSYSLPMTLQDFTIVVRQAILAGFKDQFLGQYVGPLAYDGAATNFLPLQVLGNCFGSDQFSRLLVPPILAENLSLLQTCKLKVASKKSKINETVFVPVWGFYNDQQPTWILDNNQTIAQLFLPPTQKVINLVDCTISTNTYVNANGAYYVLMLETWLARINSLKAYINVTPLSNMSPPSSAFMMQMTRVYGTVSQQSKDSLPPRLPFPCLKNISNLQGPVRRDSAKFDKKKATEPELPPPTNVQFITEQDKYAMFPVMKELHELCQFMILPSVRLDPSSSNDILNTTMYQTITGEGLRMPFSVNSVSPGYLNNAKDRGDMGVEGQGKIYSSSYSAILTKLAQEGNGGLLSGLLAGAVKSIFPGADGIIDTVASFIPI